MRDNSPTSRFTTQPVSTPEWIPTWLRKTRTFPLAALCIIFAIALQFLDIEVQRQHGLPADVEHRSTLNAVKYLPTIGIVALGFACKAIASDSKKITPWSSMSQQWSKSSNSVTLDYINRLEVFSILPAARRRHWAVFTGLIVCFICGALVAVANSLAHVELFASSSTPTILGKVTTFDFNGTLENPANHSLVMPLSYQGQQPYAAVAAEKLPNGRSAPWTKDGYVFESFTNSSHLPENATIEAPVKAFRPDWTCHPVELAQHRKSGSPGEIYLKSTTSKQPKLNCSQDITVEWSDWYSPLSKYTLGWLNITACDQYGQDLRLLAVLGQQENVTKATDTSPVSNTTLASVMCSPSFTLQDSVVRVNRSTGEVLQYRLGPSAPTSVDLQTSMGALYYYLNNPVDGRTQTAYSKLRYGALVDGLSEADPTDISVAVSWYVTMYHVDAFMSSLLDGKAALMVGSYLENPQKLKAAVERHSNHILAQVVNSLARTNDTSHLDGWLWTAGPKLFLRTTALKALQGFLVFISLACIMQSTILRPRTILREDPGSIAARGLLLACSGQGIENRFASEMGSSERHMNDALEPAVWMLVPNAKGTVMLETTDQDEHDPLNAGLTHSTEPEKHDGFRPLPLRIWAKWSVITAIILIMVALAVLASLSHSHKGICKNTRFASNAFDALPTVVLILLGYACSGIDGSVRMMAPYKSLWKCSGKTQPLLFSLREAPSVWDPLRALKNRVGFAVAASSTAILVIPAIKIMAAGLYTTVLVQTKHNIQPLVDITLTDHLQDTFYLPHSDANSRYLADGSNMAIDLDADIQTASQLTEWTMNPEFNIPVSSGVIQNLVFSNLTSIGGLDITNNQHSSVEVTVDVTAIAIGVTCEFASMGLYLFHHPDDRGYSSTAKCDTVACNNTLDEKQPNGVEYLLDLYMDPSDTYQRNRFHGSTLNRDTFGSRNDSGYQILLTDVQSVLDDLQSNPLSINQSRTFPETVYGVVCYNNLTKVTVETTFAHRTSSSTTSDTDSWSPIHFNAATIKTISPISSAPSWLWPRAKDYSVMPFDQRDRSSTAPGLLDSPSLWPTRGSSTNVFELLAAYSTYTLGNLTAILDPHNFTTAAEAVYTSYVTNMLTQLRPWALYTSNNSPPITMPGGGTITFPEARVVQDLPSTIALEACLAVMLVSVVWVAIRFPNEAVLPKNPGSIAATASLVAGSEMVERLRREGVKDMEEARGAGVWRERAALGWWPVRMVKGEEEEGRDGLSSAGEGEYGVGGGEGEEGEQENGYGGRGGQSRNGGEDAAGRENEEDEESEEDGENEDDRTGGEGRAHNERASDGDDRGAREDGEESEDANDDEHGAWLGHGATTCLRWGIDIGEGVVRGSWKEPPGGWGQV